MAKDFGVISFDQFDIYNCSLVGAREEQLN